MVQLTATGEVAANLERAERLIERCVEAHRPDLIALPEMWAMVGGAVEARAALAEGEEGGPQTALLERLARKHRLWIHAGSILARDPAGSPKHANRSLVIGPDGERLGRYDKIHLFDVALPSGQILRESDRFVAGGETVKLDLDLAGARWRLGQTVCYDLRFPELFRKLGEEGVDLFFAPSVFTHETGQAHFEPLLRARAIETASWVVAVDQCGRHDPKRRSWGHSSIIDPWGRVRLQMAEDEGVAAMDLDLEAVARARAAIPIWAHKRL